MSRFWRINTIWRKELTDTLRDRRTLVAMILVPMVLYPALMLASLQMLEVQVGQLTREEYLVAVQSPDVERWLRVVLDTDESRRVLLARSRENAGAPASSQAAQAEPQSAGRENPYEAPPPFRIEVFENVEEVVRSGGAHVGVLVWGEDPDTFRSKTLRVAILTNDSDVRSRSFAAPGLQGAIDRFGESVVAQRLNAAGLDPAVLRPIIREDVNVATQEQMAGSTLGQIVPLILIMMTITGAIYPAIDLTAGERERGTLETLMVAPVPTLDLIAGKFVVVTMVGMLSAVLNLLSIGGTIALGGLGEMLHPGAEFRIPLHVLPWVLLLLLPLAVLFSAALLAVCSFARSFKEAQNYVVPVIVAAMIPGVAGILPGTRLEGPILVMPVTNVVVLTRELFLGRWDESAVVAVLLSTTVYAAAAIAIAARLFGKEAVLFADAGSIKTLFQRRFFKPANHAGAAAALLMVAILYSLNHFLQTSLARSEWMGTPKYLFGIGLVLALLLGALPLAAARYLRVNVYAAFYQGLPSLQGLLAALCIGLSTWVLASAVNVLVFSGMSKAVQQQIAQQFAFLDTVPLPLLLALLAFVPALTEETFFRGFVLSGLRADMGRWGAVLGSAIAFAAFHYSLYRLPVTFGLGLVLAILAIQFRSIWLPMLAHAMHNCILLASTRADGLKDFLRDRSFPAGEVGILPPPVWIAGAAILLAVGLFLCFWPVGARVTAPAGRVAEQPSMR